MIAPPAVDLRFQPRGLCLGGLEELAKPVVAQMHVPLPPCIGEGNWHEPLQQELPDASPAQLPPLFRRHTPPQQDRLLAVAHCSVQAQDWPIPRGPPIV